MNLDLNQYNAFIFDLDGTLIDSEKYHADGFAHAVETLSGYKITEDERYEFFDGNSHVFTPVLAARHGLALDPSEVLELKRAHVRAHFKTELFPGAHTFIHKWKKRKRMALASNSPKQFVKNALIEAKLIDVFELVITADDVARRKPSPQMYQQILFEMKLTPDEALVIEDSPAGVEAAQGAGCPVVMVENGAGRTVNGAGIVTWRELLKA